MAAVFGFGRSAEESLAQLTEENISLCKTCNIPMKINANNSQKICPECSYVEEGYVSNGEGTKSRQCIVNTKTTCLFSSRASPDQARFAQTYKHFQHLVDQNPTYRIQRDLIEQATHLFLQVETTEGIKRSKVDNRSSVFGACIYYKALEHPDGIIWDRREIARALGLPKDGISAGEKKLIKLYCEDKIEIKLNVDTLPRYINRYIELFAIDPKYRNFLQTLGKRIADTHVAFNSFNKSKAVGIIYWFGQKTGMSINAKTVKELCFITKPTFDKVCKAIEKFKDDVIGREYLEIPA